jgi:TRAP transporter TAXI family solute receptor
MFKKKIRRKRIGLLLVMAVLVLTSFSLLAGCGSSQSGSDSAETIDILSGPAGAAWYAIGSGYAGILKTELGWNASVLTGAAVSNVVNIDQERADLGLTFTSYLPAMAKGGEVIVEVDGIKYFQEPVKNTRIMCYTGTAVYPLIVDAKSPYKTVADLKDKPIRYVTYPQGFSARYVPDQILNEYGITHESIEKAGGKVIIVSKYTEATDLLAKGQADVISFATSVVTQAAALSELEAQKPFRVLTTDDEVMDKLMQKYPLEKVVYKKGIHESVTEDVTMLSDITVWIVPASLPDEKVEKMLDALLARMETLAEIASVELHGFTAKDLGRMIGKGEQPPLHPGAVKFFTKHGVEVN